MKNAWKRIYVAYEVHFLCRECEVCIFKKILPMEAQISRKLATQVNCP
jgi:hypothetical protein